MGTLPQSSDVDGRACRSKSETRRESSECAISDGANAVDLQEAHVNDLTLDRSVTIAPHQSCRFNSFNARCPKLLPFEGFSAILVQPTIFNF